MKHIVELIKNVVVDLVGEMEDVQNHSLFNGRQVPMFQLAFAKWRATRIMKDLKGFRIYAWAMEESETYDVINELRCEFNDWLRDNKEEIVKVLNVSLLIEKDGTDIDGETYFNVMTYGGFV